MGGKSRRRDIVAAGLCCAALASCGNSAREGTAPAARAPAPAPEVTLSAEERERWVRAAPDRSTVPVLVYRDLPPAELAKQLALLRQAGYRTIALDELVRFVRRETVSLPPRPLLLTFDGGRAGTWTGSDSILRELGFSAVLFVDAGRVDAKEPGYLTWAELDRMQRSGRWDVQLQAGTGNHEIQYGRTPADVGPFYAYRGANERIDGWRERVFSDITLGERLLAFRVSGYRPLAFAPPYGNYGQAGTNDPRIPRLLLARLFLSFDLVFTQDRSGFAARGGGSGKPLGRIEVTPQVGERRLHALLVQGGS